VLVKEADRFAKARGYRWVYRHCHHNDLPIMLQWKRVGYAITEEDFSTGSMHMRKTLLARQAVHRRLDEAIALPLVFRFHYLS
jgi:hypothetical protein